VAVARLPRIIPNGTRSSTRTRHVTVPAAGSSCFSGCATTGSS